MSSRSPQSSVFGTVWIAGVGPGLGSALARTFATKAARLLLTARSTEHTASLAEELGRHGVTALALPCDAREPEAVEAAYQKARASLGAVDVLVYNVGGMVRTPVPDLSPEAFWNALAQGPYGAFLHARLVLPDMIARGRGVLLFTGATSSVMAPASAPAFAAAKFGLRGLAMSLHRAYGPKGVHVAHVLVDGVLARPGAPAGEAGYLSPEAVAAVYLHLAEQPREGWSFEVDLRPFTDDYLDN